jgi:hypothetical protein
MSVDSLAAELSRYAQLYRAKGKDDSPLWRSRYPSFPPVLCVLAGASRGVLERRRDTAIALMHSDPELFRTSEVAIRLCLAEDLSEQGPFASIFCELHHPGKSANWLGEAK